MANRALMSGCTLLLLVTLAFGNVEALLVTVKYPQQQVSAAMTLRGSACGLSWNSGLNMQLVSKNTFQVQVNCSASTTTLEMKPMVGDTWSIGSNYLVDMSSSQKQSSGVVIFPWFLKTKGAFEYVRNVWSPQLHNSRDLVIYLPPSYYENGLRTKYPTLVMHDGQNLFNASTAFGGVAWMCQDALDGEIVTGGMEEIIVVGVYNTPDRIAEYTYSVDPEYGGGKGDIYLDFLKDTVLPKVKASGYPISIDAANLGILGSSLGGLISCYAGWTRPSEYSRAGCMSSSFWWNSQDFTNVVMVQHQKPAKETFYLDSGDSGDSQDGMIQTIAVRDHMQNDGFSMDKNLFYYLDKGASHNEYFWGKRFWIPMITLFPPPLIVPH